MNNILKGLDIKRTVGKHKCEFCGKAFAQERTLLTHSCEKKRRWLQKDEKQVVLGFSAYTKFYKTAQPTAKPKTYKDFMQSPYYNAFVKFGWHLYRLQPIAPERFIDYIIRKNKKLDHWCKDSIYEEYLINHIKRESVQDALSRAIEYTQEWGEENNARFCDYFRYGSTPRIVQSIVNGRISPWIIYNCDTGMEVMHKMTDEELTMIEKYLDPMYWKEHFQVYQMDADWATNILKEAGF